MRKWLILLSALSGTAASAAPAWTWVDAEGTRHYSDRPVPGAEQVDLAGAQAFGSRAPRAARTTGQGADWRSWWRRGTFDHVEKHDDRVVAFATRLGSGRHEFSYLARATTSGIFTAAGARVEAMYAPEVTGRSAATTITVR